jgi:3-methyladenine DNA glycosylase AlkD
MDIPLLIKLFEENRCEEKAIPMQNYMKNKFPFLRIKTPERRILLKEFFNETGLLKQEFKPDFVEALWDMEEREYQNAALDYIGKFTKKLEKRHFGLIEKLIVSMSWWDTVDMLLRMRLGQLRKSILK